MAAVSEFFGSQLQLLRCHYSRPPRGSAASSRVLHCSFFTGASGYAFGYASGCASVYRHLVAVDFTADASYTMTLGTAGAYASGCASFYSYCFAAASVHSRGRLAWVDDFHQHDLQQHDLRHHAAVAEAAYGYGCCGHPLQRRPTPPTPRPSAQPGPTGRN